MSLRPEQRVAVVGGGFGGLAAACTLAARGYAVELFEANAWLGGQAAVLETQGFRFDLGPTLLWMPSVLRRVFAEAGRHLEDALHLVNLDPQWRCFFPDGAMIDLRADTQRMAVELDRFAPDTYAGLSYQRFMEFAAQVRELAERRFFWRNISGWRDLFQTHASERGRMLRELLRLRAGRTIGGTMRALFQDRRVAQVVELFARWTGSEPRRSPAALCAIAALQNGEGVWYPTGGMAAVARALANLAIDLGVQIHARREVRRFVVEANRVVGLETNAGERIDCGAVVCNADMMQTHCDLLGVVAGERFAARRRYEPACSAVVLCLGLARRYGYLQHHNFVLSGDPAEEYDAVYRRGEPAADPTCYLCAPGRTERGTAPPGGEALCVVVHVPCLRAGHDWARMLPQYRQVIINKLRHDADMEDLEGRIVFERSFTPQDMQDRYRLWRGAVYGLASHGRFRGAFKPANRSPDVEGLYLAGGTAHPGPGVPMALMSGWTAADLLDRDEIVMPSPRQPAAV